MKWLVCPKCKITEAPAPEKRLQKNKSTWYTEDFQIIGDTQYHQIRCNAFRCQWLKAYSELELIDG